MPPNIIRDLPRETKGHYSLQGMKNQCKAGVCFAIVTLISCLCAINGCNLHLIATVAGMGREEQHTGQKGTQRGEVCPGGRKVE